MSETDYRAGERVEINCTHLVGATVGACAACIAKAIAAAEERGRRAGIEEAAAQAAQIAERWNAGHAASLIRNLARTPRGHSAECGGQPAGSGCICGVGFDAAPETVTLYAVPDGIEAHIRDLHAIENALHEFEADPIAALRVVGEHVSMALHNLRALAPRDSGKGNI